MRYDGKMRQNKTGHRWLYTTTHAPCILDNKGYRQTLRIRNNYCFPTATTVTRTHLNNYVIYTVHCPSCLCYVIERQSPATFRGEGTLRFSTARSETQI